MVGAAAVAAEHVAAAATAASAAFIPDLAGMLRLGVPESPARMPVMRAVAMAAGRILVRVRVADSDRAGLVSIPTGTDSEIGGDGDIRIMATPFGAVTILTWIPGGGIRVRPPMTTMRSNSKSPTR